MRANVAIQLEQWFLDYVRPFIDGNAAAEGLPQDVAILAEVADAARHLRARL